MNFYKDASRIIDKLQRHEGTIKGLVLGDPNVKDKKRMYAIICETLKYKQVLNEIINASKILSMEKALTQSLALVLIHDFLFTKRGILVPDKVPLKKSVQGHQARLKAELAKIKVKRGATTNEELISQKAKDAVIIPRYVRVNTHKTTMKKVLEEFRGFTFVDTPDDLRTLQPKTFCKDQHLSDLLVFHPRADFHDHPLYNSGDIILQDKASCFPAHVAHASPGSHAIDACAAPGNKTSHLSALMQNTGRIWAFDLDQRRLNLLKRLTNKAGCQNITPMHGSFLDVNPHDPAYAKVEYLLLDPSCSGSGIISRLDHLVDEENGTLDVDGRSREDRLKNLSDFQIAVLRHAFKFPLAKRIVYSTCSIYSQENEHVVRAVLESNTDFELAPRESVLGNWHRRGLPEEMNGDAESANTLIRTSPVEDLTNGFFVACFVRKPSDSIKRPIASVETETKGIAETKKRKGKNNNKKKNNDSDPA